MSIKRILIPLPGSVAHQSEIEMGLTAAKALGAQVEAMFITEPAPPPRASDVRYGGSTAAAFQINRYAEERERLAAEARERFAHACAAHGIPMVAQEAPDALPAASWRQAEGSYETVAVARAAGFDLIVAASAAVTEALKAIAEGSLLQARRPVLLTPQMPGDLAGNAMVAWDESPECWHAVSAAIPFLRLAGSIQVVSVDRDATRRHASQADAVAYLRCHGITATARVVAPHLRSVGDTLLAVAAEADIGLLVMGAYSHSRLATGSSGALIRWQIAHGSPARRARAAKDR